MLFIIEIEMIDSLPGINETTGSHHGMGELQDFFSVHSHAEFDRDLPQNVSAIVGQTAFLTCLVRNLKPTQKVNFRIFLGIRSYYGAQYVRCLSFLMHFEIWFSKIVYILMEFCCRLIY